MLAIYIDAYKFDAEQSSWNDGDWNSGTLAAVKHLKHGMLECETDSFIKLADFWNVKHRNITLE